MDKNTIFMNTTTGEILNEKEATKHHKMGYNLYVMTEYGYKVGVWLWDEYKPRMHSFTERVLN